MDKNYFVSLLRKNRLLKYQLYQHQLQYRKNETELAQLGVKKRKNNEMNTRTFNTSATDNAAAAVAMTTTNRYGGACMPHVVVRRLSHLTFKRNKKTQYHVSITGSPTDYFISI